MMQGKMSERRGSTILMRFTSFFFSSHTLPIEILLHHPPTILEDNGILPASHAESWLCAVSNFYIESFSHLNLPNLFKRMSTYLL
jgi:hypothetical protein